MIRTRKRGMPQKRESRTTESLPPAKSDTKKGVGLPRSTKSLDPFDEMGDALLDK